ncbi:hypothetical protein ON010_g17522 [Phytophthora cinnamomi]|nr:hypothetical protein ON010_g17522 [Phytophthora cinnamomi]
MKPREDVSATYLIASELADIEKNEEFNNALHSCDGNEIVRAVLSTKPVDRHNNSGMDVGFEEAASREQPTTGPEVPCRTDTNIQIAIPSRRWDAFMAVPSSMHHEIEITFNGNTSKSSLKGLLQSLDEAKPGISERQRQPAGIIVKFGAEANRKSPFKT